MVFTAFSVLFADLLFENVLVLEIDLLNVVLLCGFLVLVVLGVVLPECGLSLVQFPLEDLLVVFLLHLLVQELSHLLLLHLVLLLLDGILVLLSLVSSPVVVDDLAFFIFQGTLLFLDDSVAHHVHERPSSLLPGPEFFFSLFLLFQE